MKFERFAITGSVLVFLSVALIGCASVEAPSKTAAPAAAKEDDVYSLIAKGEGAKARDFFRGKADINGSDSRGRTPLHAAVEQGDADLAKFLIALGARVDAKDASGRTPFEIAFKRSDAACVEILAAGGADLFLPISTGESMADLLSAEAGPLLAKAATAKNVETKDGKGRTLLHFVAAKGKAEAAAVLVKAGAKANAKDAEGNTPLDAAFARTDSLEYAKTAEVLVMAGATAKKGALDYFAPAVRSSNYDIRFDDGLSPLHFAAREGQTGYIAFLLDKKAKVDAKNSSGAPPLHEAVRSGKIEAAELLLQAGADPNARDAKGNSALHLVMPTTARKAGLELLLRFKADPNIKDDYGDAPLHVAVSTNLGVEIASILIAGGAEPNIRNTAGRSPLHVAVERERLDYIPVLLGKGADIFAADTAGKTPFDLALLKGGEAFKAMVTPATVLAVDNAGNTPLHVAVQSKAVSSSVAYILDKKALVNARNKSGDTPLHIAVASNQKETGELLISRGADIFAANAAGKNPLYLACYAKDGFRAWVLNATTVEARDGLGNGVLHYTASWALDALIPVMVQAGANPNAKNATGETPLFSAVKADSPSTVAALIAAGGESQARDSLGNSPLHTAVRWNAKKAAASLVSGGADANARNLAGKTPLHDAVRLGMANLEAFLLDSGASIEARDNAGNTPLMEAVNAGLIAPADRLLERGASPASRNAAGDTPLLAAVYAGRKDIANSLLAKGAPINAKNSAGVTPLAAALAAGPDMTGALLTKDRIDAASDDGETPLHIAVKSGAPTASVKAILDLGARVGDTDMQGRTALHWAVELERWDEARLLVETGADLFGADAAGKTAAGLALEKGSAAIKAVFVGPAIAGKDMVGNTLLHYAAAGNDPAAAKLLLDLGASKSAKNLSGETPLDVAKRWKRADIEKLLL